MEALLRQHRRDEVNGRSIEVMGYYLRRLRMMELVDRELEERGSP